VACLERCFRTLDNPKNNTMNLKQPPADSVLKSVFRNTTLGDIRACIAKHSFVIPQDYHYNIPLSQLDPIEDREEIARRKAKSKAEKLRKMERQAK